MLWLPDDKLSFWLKGGHTRWDVAGRNIDVFNSITHPDPGVVTQPGGTLPAGIQVDHITALNGAQASLGRPAADGELNYLRDANGDTSANRLNTALLQVDYELAPGTLTADQRIPGLRL